MLFLDAWRNKVAADLCGRKGFRGGPLLDIHGSLQLLYSSHVRERDKALLRVVSWLGVFGMGFSLAVLRVSLFHVRSVVLLTVVVSLEKCAFPPLVGIRESPEFHDLMRMDKGHRPDACFGTAGFPMLSGVNGASPWAACASEGAGCLVEVALGQYSSGTVS